MKKITLLLLFTFIISGSLFSMNNPKGVTLTKVAAGYIVNFDMPQYGMTNTSVKGEDFINLSIEDYGITPDIGYPCLPQISFNLFIADNEQLSHAQDLQLTKESTIMSNKIYPTQAPWPKTNNPDERPFTINREYYNTKGTESPFVSISEPFIIGGVKGIRITIIPFSYNPLENRLTLVTKGSFRIRLQNEPRTSALHSYTFNDFLKVVFVNYEPSAITPTNNYLIITAPEYETAMAPFVAQKTSLGYNVFMVNTTVTGTTNTAIKDYIQQRYNNLTTRPEFVLLVGDVDKIPEWTGGGEGSPHTDLNYSLLEGSDLFPDVFLGRFSVSNTSQLGNIITKSVYMENNINSLPKKAIFMASNDNYAITEGTHNFVIDSFFAPNSYTYQKLYVHTYGATTAQLIAALNANQSFAIYSGHGAETYWADGPVLYQSDVNALTNTVFPYVYSFACLTGRFEYSSECFGETWIRTTNGGSVFWGSTVTSYWDEDDILEKRLFRAMFVDHLIKTSPMFVQAKIYFVAYYGTITPTVQRYMEMYNCLGDPSIYEATYGPAISHNPLPNTENLAGPYVVNCVIVPAGSAIDPSKTKVMWTRGTSFTDSVSLTNTSGNNWTANIPGNNNNAAYRYYIKTSDMMNRYVTLPGGAPANYFSFIAMPDTVKPVIVHTALPDCPKSQWPATVSASVTDNIGIDSVWVRWYKNSTATGIKHFKLNNTSGNNYSALFNSDSSQVAYGDSIFYRVFARDNSSHHNADSTSLYRFNIIAVTSACIGTGTTSVAWPYNTYWWGSKTDMLYTASEILAAGGSAGVITKIGFDVVSASSQAMNGFQIKMQMTTATSLSGFAQIGWTTVYNGTYTVPGTGLQFVELQSPYYWNGQQNLLIEICFGNTSYTTATNVNASSVPGMTWEQHQDVSTGCSFTAGSSQSNRPNLCMSINLLVGKEPISSDIPRTFSLAQNYPNPFNPVTSIKYSVPKQSLVKLIVYDILGREVAKLVNEVKQAGNYSVSFDASSYASGVYFYRMEAGDFTDVKKMVLIK
jgi:hypothetical protein